MKKSVDLQIGNKTYTLCFTIRALSELERLEGRSLILFFSAMGKSPAAFVGMITIDFIAHALKAGMQNAPEDFDPYSFIDEYCAQDDGSLETLISKVMKGILASGLFTTGSREETEKMIQEAFG